MLGDHPRSPAAIPNFPPCATKSELFCTATRQILQTQSSCAIPNFPPCATKSAPFRIMTGQRLQTRAGCTHSKRALAFSSARCMQYARCSSCALSPGGCRTRRVVHGPQPSPGTRIQQITKSIFARPVGGGGSSISVLNVTPIDQTRPCALPPM